MKYLVPLRCRLFNGMSWTLGTRQLIKHLELEPNHFSSVSPLNPLFHLTSGEHKTFGPCHFSSRHLLAATWAASRPRPFWQQIWTALRHEWRQHRQRCFANASNTARRVYDRTSFKLRFVPVRKVVRPSSAVYHFSRTTSSGAYPDSFEKMH